MATEKRLIDANEWDSFFAEHIYNRCFRNEYEQGYTDALDRVDDWMDEHPTVDAVEVVRCKDCKHYDNSEGICWCHLNSKFFPGGMDWHGFPEDGFCSYGERSSDVN